MLPETIHADDLAAANSMMIVSSVGSTALGFAASGLIASQLPIQWAFYIDALSFVLSAVCILGVRSVPLTVEGRTTARTVLHNLREGVRFFIRTPVLRRLFLVYVPSFTSFGLFNALLLPFAFRILHGGEFAYGLLLGMDAVGAAVGSLLMLRLAARLSEDRWLALSFLGMGVSGVLFSFVSSVWVAIGLHLAIGMFNAPSAVARQLMIQRNTPRELLGRVNSAFFMMRDVVFLGGMAAGGLADLFDVRVLVFGSTLVMVVLGLLVLALPWPGATNRE